MPKLLKYILYIAVFFSSYLLFVYWMLPMETLKSRVILATEQALGPDFEVKVEKMKTYHLTGATLENITIRRLNAGKEEPVLRADRLRAHLGIFSWIFGRPKVSYDVRMEKARVSGFVQKAEDKFKLQASFKNLDLGGIPYVQLTTGLHFLSSINGKVALDYDQKQPLKTEGEIEINIDRLSLKKSNVGLGEMGSFPLPDLDLASGNSGVQGIVEKGSMRVDHLKLKAADFDLDLKGRLFLAPQIAMVRLNLQGGFQFSPKLWALLDPILPEPWASELKKQKGQAEAYPLSVSGQLNMPQAYSGTLRLYPFKPF